MDANEARRTLTTTGPLIDDLRTKIAVHTDRRKRALTVLANEKGANMEEIARHAGVSAQYVGRFKRNA